MFNPVTFLLINGPGIIIYFLFRFLCYAGYTDPKHEEKDEADVPYSCC